MSSVPNYRDLQNSVDRLVGMLGLHKAITLLEDVTSGKETNLHNSLKYNLISSLIQTKCAEAFGIPEGEFAASTSREHKECRMAGFHLLKKYTDVSHSKMSKAYGLSKQQALYAWTKCEEMLSASKFYPVFFDKYEELDRITVLFIAQLSD